MRFNMSVLEPGGDGIAEKARRLVAALLEAR